MAADYRPNYLALYESGNGRAASPGGCRQPTVAALTLFVSPHEALYVFRHPGSAEPRALSPCRRLTPRITRPPARLRLMTGSVSRVGCRPLLAGGDRNWGQQTLFSLVPAHIFRNMLVNHTVCRLKDREHAPA